MEVKHLYIPNHAKWLEFYEKSLKNRVSTSLRSNQTNFDNSDGRVLTLSTDSVLPIEKKELPKIDRDKTNIQIVTPSEQTIQQAVSQLKKLEKQTLKSKVKRKKRDKRKTEIESKSGYKRKENKKSLKIRNPKVNKNIFV